MAKKKLSILLAAHREGLIAHKTLLSLADCLQRLKQAKIPYEVLIHIDNGDAATKDYFKQQTVVKAKIIESMFKDLGASRNALAAAASGDYLATLDADDLISQNWFVEAYKLLEESKNKRTVVHSSASVNFGEMNILWWKTDSKSLDEERLINVGANRWDSAVVAPREVFEEFPYQPNTEGYGSEDWHFNSQTLAAGIRHVVAPETILFVRRKSESEMTRQADSFNSVRYTELLDVGAVKKIDRSMIDNMVKQPANRQTVAPLVKRAEKKARKTVESAIRTGRQYRFTRVAIAKLKQLKDGSSQQDQVAPQVDSRFPAWLIDEWRFQHKNERQVFPSKGVLDSLIIYRTDEIQSKGATYKAVLDQLSDRHIDHAIFVPWLDRGGADLVAIRYANMLHSVWPKKRIAVIATHKEARNVWVDRLDDGIDFIDFGTLAFWLTDADKLRVLGRIIVQTKLKSMQIINSSVAYDWVAKHQQLVSSLGISVYPSAFCPDISDEGRVMGHIHAFLPGVYDASKRIFTDNQNTIDELVEEYGYDPERFKVHYQPVDPVDYRWRPPSDGPIKLLWASRIAPQKRPDLLIAIAKRMQKTHPNVTIDVFGDAHPVFGNVVEYANLPNLQYEGTFNGFYTLDHGAYKGLVYTSDFDGMPNIVLEANNIGMTMVASDIGGISEIIEDGKNGFLVENTPEAFVEAIDKLIAMPAKKLKGFCELSVQKIGSQHDIEAYHEVIKQDIPL